MRIALVGATGRTGQTFINRALKENYSIKALARDPEKIPQTSENLQVIKGDALNPDDVHMLVEKTDVVVSLIGHVQGSPKWLQTEGIKNLILAMKLHSVERIISLTGGGVRYEKDRPKLIDSLFKGALKIFAASVLRDAISHAKILKESNLEWTIVRVPMLTDGPSRGDYRVGWVGVNAGMRISRADVADFIVREIENKKYVREMPFLSY